VCVLLNIRIVKCCFLGKCRPTVFGLPHGETIQDPQRGRTDGSSRLHQGQGRWAGLEQHTRMDQGDGDENNDASTGRFGQGGGLL